MPMRSVPRCCRILAPPLLALALAACGSGGSSTCGIPCTIGPGAQFLLATSNTGQVLSLPVNPETGAVGAATSAPGPTMSLGLTAAGSQYFYASDFQNDLIYAYSIDPTSGAPTPVSGSPFPLSQFSVPGGLAASAAGNFLYAGVAGGIDGFTLPAGVPTTIAGSPFPPGNSLQLAIAPSNRFLFGSLVDPPNGVAAFTIDPTSGALTSVPGSPFPFPGQTVLNSRPFGIVVDSGGQFVYTALTATNQVAAFSIVSATGALTPVPGSPFTAGTTPLTLATTGQFLYANNDGTISAYSVDPTSGVLTPVAGSPFAFAVGSLTIDPSGSFLYGATSIGIDAFSINADGSLTLLPGSPFPANSPQFLTMVQMPGQGG